MREILPPNRQKERNSIMMKQEFEARIGAEITPEQYRVVERVYMWHPSIPNVGGKDILAQLAEWSVCAVGVL